MKKAFVGNFAMTDMDEVSLIIDMITTVVDVMEIKR